VDRNPQFESTCQNPQVRVTTAVDYAVRAVLEIAVLPPGARLKGDVIAEHQDMSFRYTERLLAELRRAGIVASQRGHDGGYWLAKPASAISVADVIRAVDGPLADVHGTPPEDLKLAKPADITRELWVATRAALRSVLEEVTLADLAAGKLPRKVQALLDDEAAWHRREPPTPTSTQTPT
jgi:Rrf2 family protein